MGIDAYPDIPEELRLKGSARDVEWIASTLIESFGFASDDIERLVDERATCNEILDALDRLVRTARPGDVVVVYYSGHGTKVWVDNKASGRSELREGIVPFDPVQDTGKNLTIVDLELRDRLRSLAARPCEVVLILDTCFAGGGFRSAGSGGRGSVRFRDLTELPAVVYEGPESHREVEEYRPRDPARTGWHSSSHVLLAACDSDQSAREVEIEPGWTLGLFTSRLVLVLRQALGGMTYEHVMEQAYLAVVESTAHQHPQLKGPGGNKLLAGIPIDHARGSLVEHGRRSQVDPTLAADQTARRFPPLPDLGTVTLGLQRCADTLRIAPFASESPLRILRQLRTGAWVEALRNEEAEWEFSQGDGLAIEILNTAKVPIHLTVLSLGVGGDLYRLRTLLGFEEGLEPGAKLQVGGSEGVPIQLYLPPSFPGANGRECYFVFASTRPVPWWTLCLEEISATDPGHRIAWVTAFPIRLRR